MKLNKKDFQPYTYEQTQRVLNQRCVQNFPSTKEIVLVVGADGSGKSTLIANLYNNNLLALPYINKEIYERKFCGRITDEIARRNNAVYKTIEYVSDLINKGKSFCYEANLLNSQELGLIEEAKKYGYRITVIYAYTNNYDINISRVSTRSGQGGEALSSNEIKIEFENCESQATKLIPICNEFHTFDNSLDPALDKVNLVVGLRQNNYKGLDKTIIEDRGMTV